MRQMRPVELSLHPPHCDDSGLCEAADEVLDDQNPMSRVLDQASRAVVLVDLSPIRVGHCLITPREHVTSTLALDPVTNDACWDLAERSAHRLQQLTGTSVMLLEHGLHAAYLGPSCVRHAHVHACPVDLPLELMSALSAIRSLEFFDTRRGAESHAARYDSHVIGRFKKDWFAGAPDPSIRQFTRALLSRVVASPPPDVDWAIGALGAKFIKTLELFGREFVSTRRMGPPNASIVLSSGAARCGKEGR